MNKGGQPGYRSGRTRATGLPWLYHDDYVVYLCQWEYRWKVLWVEDNPWDARLVKEILRWVSYKKGIERLRWKV
jgi:hypothetical protein